ncbi:MAG TPA: aminodeoxychorismate/anthranilate synthase component II, partial [Solirubrobacterales bacterium]|nr:aminodeoxychorismate/anthranilate synthase component II [Solirubrobacterales bacterium]
MKLLLVDNYDSYTYNLRQLLAQILGEEPEVRRNDELPPLEAVQAEFDAVVISPGPGRPERGRDFGPGIELIRGFDGPLLGVCLGLQGIVHAFGGEVGPAPEPVHGHSASIRHEGSLLFSGIPPQFEGVRYHSLAALEPLPDCLRVSARAADGVVMAVEHLEHPIWGLQFHPESVGTACGEQVLRNFVAQVPSVRSLSGAPPRPPARRAAAPLGFRRFERELAVPLDPAAAFTALFGADPHAFWLDGQGDGGGEVVIGTADGPGGEVLAHRVGEGAESFFALLRRRLAERRIEPRAGGGFGGGYVGYLGYELKADLGSPCSHRADTPDACLMFATRAVALDPVTGAARALCIAPPELSDAEAEATLDEITARLTPPKPRLPFACHEQAKGNL